MIESILEKAIVRLRACDYQLKITRKASQLPYDFSVSWGDIKKRHSIRKYYTSVLLSFFALKYEMKYTNVVRIGGNREQKSLISVLI